MRMMPIRIYFFISVLLQFALDSLNVSAPEPTGSLFGFGLGFLDGHVFAAYYKYNFCARFQTLSVTLSILLIYIINLAKSLIRDGH